MFGAFDKRQGRLEEGGDVECVGRDEVAMLRGFFARLWGSFVQSDQSRDRGFQDLLQRVKVLPVRPGVGVGEFEQLLISAGPRLDSPFACPWPIYHLG